LPPQDFSAVTSLAPSDPSGFSNRGYAYRKLGDYDAAVQDYTVALSLTPDSIRLHNNRAYCLAKVRTAHGTASQPASQPGPPASHPCCRQA
jgi:Flp pilus assembly protein TadD